VAITLRWPAVKPAAQRWTARALRFLALGVLASACLPGDPAVQGHLLYPGPEVINPRFRTVNSEPWVLFDVRTSRSENGLAARYDLHLARWTDGAHQPVLANRSIRGEWPAVSDADRASFYMIDEREAVGLGRTMATLVRLRLATGVVETIDDVVGYGLHPDRRLFHYRRYVSGSSLPELHLRDLAGNDRNLGPSRGDLVFTGKDRLYFLSGGDWVLSRVTGLDGEVQPLRPRVRRFWLHQEERFAVLSIASEDGSVFTRILDLETGQERSLPVENPCCWQRIQGDTFIYAEAAGADTPAVLHRYDLQSGVDRVVVLPEGLADVQRIVDRPNSPEMLLTDRNGRAAVLRALEPDADPAETLAAQLLPLLLEVPLYTSDGRYLLYLDPQPPPPPPAVRRNPVGHLMALDASDYSQPPWVLTPRGTSCLVEPRGYEPNFGDPGKVLFWAYYGLGATDLYLGDLDSRQTRKLAVGVGPMTLLQTRLLGVTRIGQDHTGDLVLKDPVTGAEQVLEHGVVTVTTRVDPMLGDIAAFVVRERNPGSARNGLWATMLPPP
jgi:hypothetical protein